MNTQLLSTIIDGYSMNILQDMNMPIVSSYLHNKDLTDRNFLFDLAMYSSDVKFMNKSYEGILKELNNSIIDNKDILIQRIKSVHNYKSLRYLLSRDLSLCTSIDLFLKYKQIYTVDKIFMQDLISTQLNVPTIPLTVFDHLPYDSFYIDLEDTDICKYIYGCFISVRIYHKNLELLAQIIGKPVETSDKLESDGYFGTHLCRVSLDVSPSESDESDSDIEIGIDLLNGFDNIDSVLSFLHDNMPGLKNWDYLFMWYVIVPFIMYLNSYNADVHSTNNHKYKHKNKNKSNISNCSISEVGYTYGCTLRKIHKNTVTSKILNNDMNIKPIRSRRSHMRRAHWHKYKYGPNKQYEKLIWMPPMYIRGSTSSNITIHKVKS